MYIYNIPYSLCTFILLYSQSIVLFNGMMMGWGRCTFILLYSQSIVLFNGMMLCRGDVHSYFSILKALSYSMA